MWSIFPIAGVEVPTAVNMSWFLSTSAYLFLRLIFDSEDYVSKFLRNGGKFLPDYTTSHLKG
jgi:hypothetical protein